MVQAIVLFLFSLNLWAGFPPPVYAPSSATANGIVSFVGSSPRNVTSIGPATSGYIMTSNGVNWYAAAPGGGTVYDQVLNDDYYISATGSGVQYYRCRASSNFATFYLTLGNKGSVSSGSLTVDIKKATSYDGTYTSIFSSAPTRNFATAADSSEDSGTQSTTTCAAGDWLRLDVTSVPSGWAGLAHLMFYLSF